MGDMEEIDEKERLAGDKKLPVSVLLRRSVEYAKPEALWLILALFILLVHVGFDLVLPLLVQKITDTLSAGGGELAVLIKYAVIYFLISVINNGFFYIESLILVRSGQNIVFKIRMDVFEHIENMSQNQFAEMPVGSLVTRVASYTQSLSDLFTTVLVNILKNIGRIVGVYAIMLSINVRLSLYLFAPLAIVFISSLVFSKIVGKLFRKERKSLSDLNAFTNENLSGMKITQIFNRQDKKLEEFDEKNGKLKRAAFGVVLAFGLYRPFITLVYVLTVALTFKLGVDVGLSPGSIVAFYLYVENFFRPVQELADQINNIQKALTASERLFNLLDVEPEVRDRPDAVDIGKVEGRIEFRNVWFAYEKDNWILKDVSFVIEPKQTCAFVGATGAGKTTILGLIVRNYEIQKGQILIDGVDISHIRIKSLRHAVGQMLQDVFLFGGTIRSNISLHDESITDEDIYEACRYVNADSFIEKLPAKYDEEIKARGENLSQGQRQLISFARTVLHKPQILILDEATANIDTETEVIIQQSLEKMRSIGTMLVVAHRLSTIQHADQIIVLQNGEIIERGNHQELLQNHGYYWKLYKLQFEG